MTIDQWKIDRRRHCARMISGSAIIVSCFGLLISALILFKKPPRPKTAETNGAFWTVVGDNALDLRRFYGSDDMQPKEVPVTDQKLVRAYEAALNEWTTALRTQVPRWGLYKGEPRSCAGSNAAACAWRLYGRIVIVDLGKMDPKTVFMHEIGHMLGVPHIQTDALMNNDEAANTLERPTPLAVAVAKFMLEKKRKSNEPVK